MPRYHDVWDSRLKKQVKIAFTDEEETARDTEEQSELAGRPMFEWETAIKSSDSDMTRAQEDLLDHLENDHGQVINTNLKSKRDSKKLLRSQRPQ